MEEEWEQVNKQTKNTTIYVRSELVACLTCATETHVCTRSSIWPLIVSNDSNQQLAVQAPRDDKSSPTHSERSS